MLDIKGGFGAIGAWVKRHISRTHSSVAAQGYSPGQSSWKSIHTLRDSGDQQVKPEVCLR
jgi:prephenate dehydrogenase